MDNKAQSNPAPAELREAMVDVALDPNTMLCP
jgi:hypothetical protein